MLPCKQPVSISAKLEMCSCTKQALSHPTIQELTVSIVALEDFNHDSHWNQPRECSQEPHGQCRFNGFIWVTNPKVYTSMPLHSLLSYSYLFPLKSHGAPSWLHLLLTKLFDLFIEVSIFCCIFSCPGILPT